MKKSVLCIARNENQAEKIIQRLLSVDFVSDDISILMTDRKGSPTRQEGREFETRNVRGNQSSSMGFEKKSKAPQGAATGAVAGGIIGGTLGLLAGIGSLAIPGVGPFIAAGPIMAALSGSALGGTVGLIAGGLIGLDIPEIEAKQYEGKLKKGSVLIAVHTETNEQIEEAKNIFKSENAEDISVVSEKKQKVKAY